MNLKLINENNISEENNMYNKANGLCFDFNPFN